MKNFKLFALVLCLVMLVSSAAMADMTPGTYTGVATGMFDGLTVEVTVSATAIEDIKVTSMNVSSRFLGCNWPLPTTTKSSFSMPSFLRIFCFSVSLTDNFDMSTVL